VDQVEGGNRALWINIRTFSPLSSPTTRLKLCLVSYTWRGHGELVKAEEEQDEEEEEEEEEWDGELEEDEGDAEWGSVRKPVRTGFREAKRALLKVRGTRTYPSIKAV
jgi:hypothetical protein